MPEGADASLDKVLRPSLRAQLAELRGVPEGALPPALLDIRVERIGDVYLVRPRDWEQLRHEDGGAGRPGPRGQAAVVDWAEHGDALAARGPWDLVLAADVLYLRANVETALRLFGRLLAPGGEILLADPGRAGTRDFLAAARHGEIAIHRLRVAVPHA